MSKNNTQYASDSDQYEQHAPSHQHDAPQHASKQHASKPTQSSAAPQLPSELKWYEYDTSEDERYYFGSGQPINIFREETTPAEVDANDDYNEEQDRVQVLHIDNHRFQKDTGNLLLVANQQGCPSLKQADIIQRSRNQPC